MSQRTDRIDQLLREEIAALLARDVADPRIGFATITDVETTPDLRHAKIWVSVIGPAAERDETLAALQHAMGFVQRELGHRLRLKRIPALHVRLDETAERSTRVARLLDGIDSGIVAEDLPSGETLPTPVARIAHEGEAATGDEAPAAADAIDPGAPTGGPGRRRPSRPVPGGARRRSDRAVRGRRGSGGR